jgi:N-methylhydantoinase A/oxoprolinase/acetone carboxylase beta subunit
MLRGEDVSRNRLEEEFHGMEHLAQAQLKSEGLPVERMTSRRFVDARYVGQSYEITIDYPAPARRADADGLRRSIAERFYRAHLQRFGYADRGEPVEIVNLRLKLVLAVDKPKLVPEPVGPADALEAKVGQSEVVYPEGPLATPLYLREKLHSGNRIPGPALVLQMDTTIVVPPGWGGTVDPFGNLVLEPG